MPNNNNINIGNSGEYFVAAELERRGFIAAVPMSNVENFDILAINKKNHKQFAIQVKTTFFKQKKWTLSQKNEELKNKNIVYFFVSLNGYDSPEYHIVPSEIVATEIKNNHTKWLNTKSKKGILHKDNPLRNFEDSDDKYLNNWILLE